MFEGIVINKGLAINKTFVKKINNVKIEYRNIGNVEGEIQKLDRAKKLVCKHLEEIHEKTLKLLGEEEANIYTNHLKTLNSSILVGQVKKDIEEQSANAEFILNKIRKKYVKMYSNVDDVYLKRKSDSIQYVIRMLILEIMDFDTNNLDDLDEACILVSKTMSKNDYLKLANKDLKGIILEDSNKYAYAKILGETLKIPVIVGVKDASKRIRTGEKLILDCAGLGNIVLEPSEEEVQIYEKMLQFDNNENETEEFLSKILEDNDRRLVSSIVNTSGLANNDDLKVALVKTEFSYIGRNQIPKFADLVEDYEKIYASDAVALPLVFRALNVNSEHEIPFSYRIRERNPLMGLRGSKWLLSHRKIMVEQIAAIIKASGDATPQILFSNIGNYNQIIEIKVVIEEAKILAGVDDDKEVKIGVEIDNPSSAILLKTFSDEIGFVIINSSKLTEFLKGVDKSNEYANLDYDVLCPSVIKFIFDTIQAAHEDGLFVSVMGDITKDIKIFPLLLGMGVDQIIVEERYKNAWWYIHKTDIKKWREILTRCMEVNSSYNVSMIINEEITKMLDV